MTRMEVFKLPRQHLHMTVVRVLLAHLRGVRSAAKHLNESHDDFRLVAATS